MLKQNKWPILNTLLDLEVLTYEAYALAAHLLNTNEDESCAAFICHLMLAAQKGHVCIEVGQDFVNPAVENVWIGNLDASLLNQIHTLILRGSITCPDSLVGYTIEDASKPICRFHNFFYFQKYWHQEQEWINCLKNMLEAETSLSFNQSDLQQEVYSLQNSQKLLPEQANAILQASKHNLLMICGGPGTGKTYTAGILIKTLWNQLSDQDKKHFRISLAAPTGKAAANLQNSLVKAIGDVSQCRVDKAKTLHALLDIDRHQSYKQPTYSPLPADLILVDECSMIELAVMRKLFMSIKPGARLILLGDPHQLPAVGIGSPFAHLKDFLQNSQVHASKVCELRTCLRSDLKSILELASTIKLGETTASLSLLEKCQDGVECHFMNANVSLNELYAQFIEKTLHYFTHHSCETEKLFTLFNQFRILSPLRKGPLGIDALNQLLMNELLKKTPKDSPLAIPILLTKNDRKLDLVNGEIGVLVKHNKEGIQQGDYVLFPAKEGDQPFRKIPALLLSSYDYAYCLSVHKSQGSEFKHVLLVLPQGSEIFGREGLYTAVTRAQNHIQLWAERETLIQTIQRSSERVSAFSLRMNYKATET